jgi:hypothetical protein
MYLIDPDAAARIRDTLPDVRLIAILRNPVERAHAGWMGLRRDGVEPAATFEEALSLEDTRLGDGWPPTAGLFRNGLYFQMLSRYYDQFPRERIRVYLFDDLVRDAAALLRDLFTFLDVDPAFSPDTSQRHAVTGMVRNRLLRTLWTNSHGPRRLTRPLLPQRLRDRAFTWVTRDVVKTPLSLHTRRELAGRFRSDIVALQELIRRDLSGWLDPGC